MDHFDAGMSFDSGKSIGKSRRHGCPCSSYTIRSKSALPYRAHAAAHLPVHQHGIIAGHNRAPRYTEILTAPVFDIDLYSAT